jgi:amidohydrolase
MSIDLRGIEEKANSLEPWLVEVRRHFHANPELSNQEYRTADAIAGYLSGLGLEVQCRVGRSGVVGILQGTQPGPCVALRADMDALPINEAAHHACRSATPGVSHACGHDAHMAMALGVARVLAESRARLKGTVKFIFQPAEELVISSDEGGAYRMIEAGVLRNPEVQKIFALHVMPTLERGTVGYHDGAVWASNDRLEMIIQGRKTHGAYPHTGLDAILAASHVFIALQNMISRQMDARDPFLISFGLIEGGDQFNILPDRVRMEGMFRALNPEVRRAAPAKIRQVASVVAEAFGAQCEIQITPGVPVNMNHPELVARSLPVLKQILGEEKVLPQKPQMGAEDFALYAEQIPALYLLLGVRNEARGICGMLHTAEFDVDEPAMVLGVKLMSRLLVQELQS